MHADAEQMSRVLFTWELGGNLGHLARYMPIARQLRQRGHEVLFALKERDSACALIAGEGFRSLQAPFCFAPEIAGRGLLNYSDIIEANGFGDVGSISALMDGWSSIFSESDPDVVVAQFAPSSVLAARLSRMQVMRVDSGFGCPPDQTPFPGFRPWLEVAVEELLVRERRVLGNINQVCRKLGVAPFGTLQDVFRTDADLLQTVPELDHYTGRCCGNYIGPLFDLDGGELFAWPEGQAQRVLLYLRPFDGLRAVFEALASSGCHVVAAIPGIDENLRTEFSTCSFQISAAPVRLAALLPKADLAVAHGGHGLASACLLAGIPMLLLPQLAEQLMTLYNVERLGIGAGIRGDEAESRFAAIFRRMTTQPHFRENAVRLSRKYAGYDMEIAVRTLCDRIENVAAPRDCCDDCG